MRVTSSGRRSVLREPLFHFLVAGALLFAVDSTLASRADREIVIDEVLVNALRTQYEARFARPPSHEVLEGLIAEFAREEALVREARTRGLSHGDPIIRRRLVQKVEYLLQGIASASPPGDAALQAFLEAHVEQYQTPPATSFTHVFFSRERHDGHDCTRVEELLTEFRSAETPPARAAERGDPFARGYDFANLNDRHVEGAFGSRFLTNLREQPLDRWSGPLESTFGCHAVRVDGRRVTALPPLETVRARVTHDWLAAESDTAYADALQSALDRHPVVRFEN